MQIVGFPMRWLISYKTSKFKYLSRMIRGKLFPDVVFISCYGLLILSSFVVLSRVGCLLITSMEKYIYSLTHYIAMDRLIVIAQENRLLMLFPAWQLSPN